MNGARHLEGPAVRDRLWTVLIALLLAGHAILIASLASRVISVERSNYEPWPFVWVASAALFVGVIGIALARRHLRAMALCLATITAAAVLTPSALAVVLLCLLSAYVLGLRVIRFLRTQSERALPWTIPMLAGLCIWIGLVGATAALKMHFAPVYGLLLLAPLAFAWTDVRTTLRTLYASASTTEDYAWTERGWLVLAFVVFTVHLILVARPEVGYDANTMHLQISAIMAEEHRFRFDATRYLWALMPLGADWAYSVAYLLDGETAARATNLAFGLILCVLVYPARAATRLARDGTRQRGSVRLHAACLCRGELALRREPVDSVSRRHAAGRAGVQGTTHGERHRPAPARASRRRRHAMQGHRRACGSRRCSRSRSSLPGVRIHRGCPAPGHGAVIMLAAVLGTGRTPTHGFGPETRCSPS